MIKKVRLRGSMGRSASIALAPACASPRTDPPAGGRGHLHGRTLRIRCACASPPAHPTALISVLDLAFLLHLHLHRAAAFRLDCAHAYPSRPPPRRRPARPHVAGPEPHVRLRLRLGLRQLTACPCAAASCFSLVLTYSDSIWSAMQVSSCVGGVEEQENCGGRPIVEEVGGLGDTRFGCDELTGVLKDVQRCAHVDGHERVPRAPPFPAWRRPGDGYPAAGLAECSSSRCRAILSDSLHNPLGVPSTFPAQAPSPSSTRPLSFLPPPSLS